MGIKTKIQLLILSWSIDTLRKKSLVLLNTLSDTCVNMSLLIRYQLIVIFSRQAKPRQNH